MKKLVAFLMAFALCVMCFGTYGVSQLGCADDCADHDHSNDLVVHAVDEDEPIIREYLYINRKETTYAYSELTQKLRVTLTISSESVDKGVEGRIVVRSPYNQALGTPTISSAYVFGASFDASDTADLLDVSGSYSTLTFEVESESARDNFFQTAKIVLEYPVNSQNALQFYWMRTVSIYVDGDVRTVGGELVEFENLTSYTAYLCNHSSSEYRVTTPATCESAGVRQLICSSCEYVIKTETLLPTDHNLDLSKAYNTNLYPEIKATCAKTGSGCYKCVDCGKLINGTVPKLDHKLGDRYLKNGTYYVKCSVCSAEIQAPNQCPHDLNAYVLLNVITSSTCNTKGSARYQCPTCKEVETRELPLTDHKLGAPTVTKNASCLENGSQTRTCSVCLQMIAEPIPATGHTYGSWQVTVQATCISTGTQVRTCTKCGNIETQQLQGVGHNYSNWFETVSPTCTALGTSVRTCMLCGDRQEQPIPMVDHQYGSYATTTPATCVAAGEETRYCVKCNAADKRVVNPIADNHKFGEWTTVSDKTCTTNGEKTRTCEYCNAVDNDVVVCTGHQFGAPTTEGKVTTKVCAVCAYKESVESLKDGSSKKTLTSHSGSLVLAGAEAGKNYTFEFDVPTMEKEAYYKQYHPGFQKAYTLKVLCDGKEVAVNADMDVVVQTGIEGYEISLTILRGGSFWPVTDFERDDDTVTIAGEALVGAEVIFVERGEEIKPNIVIPIIVTVATLLVAGGAICFFMLKGKKKSEI